VPFLGGSTSSVRTSDRRRCPSRPRRRRVSRSGKGVQGDAGVLREEHGHVLENEGFAVRRPGVAQDRQH